MARQVCRIDKEGAGNGEARMKCICQAHPKDGYWLSINCPVHGNRFKIAQEAHTYAARYYEIGSTIYEYVVKKRIASSMRQRQNRKPHERIVMEQRAVIFIALLVAAGCACACIGIFS